MRISADGLTRQAVQAQLSAEGRRGGGWTRGRDTTAIRHEASDTKCVRIILGTPNDRQASAGHAFSLGPRYTARHCQPTSHAIPSHEVGCMQGGICRGMLGIFPIAGFPLPSH